MRLITTLLLLWGTTTAQSIPNKANLVIIKGVSFDQLCNTLLDSGYAIASKQNDIQQVTTEMRQYQKANAAYKIVARVKDSVVYMRAYFTAPYSFSDAPLWKDQRAVAVVSGKGKMKTETFSGYPFYRMLNIARSLSPTLEAIIEQ